MLNYLTKYQDMELGKNFAIYKPSGNLKVVLHKINEK
jgi:hypothetical protein